MSIISETSRLYRDNLRRKRRSLQGRGVNLRETIITGSVYAADRLIVPGLHDDDTIISVLDLTDLNDATGYLDVAGETAVLDVFTGDKGITFTARKPGEAGNDLYVQAAADPGASAPLSVTVVQHPSVSDGVVVLVNLATDSSGVALTTSDNSAANVREVVLETQAAAKLVDAVLDGTGATAWTAAAATALAGGADFKQGPSVASLTLAGIYSDEGVRYVARKTGEEGNDDTVAYTAGGTLGVVVTGTDIVVTFVEGITTADDVIAAVNADLGATALVLATRAPGATGTGFISTVSATNLAGGVNPGIKLSVGSGSVKLKVLWLTSDERDEN